MEIRIAEAEDLSWILRTFDMARAYMRSQGNLTQWAGGYPDEAVVLEDIRQGNCYICQENREKLGVFTYFYGEDPTYNYIEGAWKNSRPYGVIHRIAVRAHNRGVAGFCFSWGFARSGNLKMDTHRDNIPMQRALEKNGFQKCGTIYLANGEPRLAYQKG